jgi:hypothetical protein
LFVLMDSLSCLGVILNGIISINNLLITYPTLFVSYINQT